MSQDSTDNAGHPAIQLHARIRTAVAAILTREGYSRETGDLVGIRAATEAELALQELLSYWDREAGDTVVLDPNYDPFQDQSQAPA